MKSIIFALFAISMAMNLRGENAFKQFQSEFGKNYLASELAFREKVFEYNMIWAEEVNRSQNSYKVGATIFADMTNTEFANSKLCGCMLTPPMRKPATPIMGDFEDEIDWRVRGAVSDVKDQKSCGSCWAFSAVGALEGANFIKNGKLLRFSEQQLVDCDPKSHGCSGGLMTYAFEYVMKKGLCLEDDYPYTAKDEDCKDNKCQAAVHITGYEETIPNDGTSLKAAITKGPTSVAVMASSAAFQMYKEGILDSESCGVNLNHGITAVGYGKDYITCKNSWGAKWGNKGYIQIKYVEKGAGICGLNKMNCYPVM